MEDNVFPRPAVAGELEHFIEARLHSDAHDLALRKRIVEDLVPNIANGNGQPIYVAWDPVTMKELGRYNGAARTQEHVKEFIAFLAEARALAAAKGTL